MAALLDLGSEMNTQGSSVIPWLSCRSLQVSLFWIKVGVQLCITWSHLLPYPAFTVSADCCKLMVLCNVCSQLAPCLTPGHFRIAFSFPASASFFNLPFKKHLFFNSSLYCSKCLRQSFFFFFLYHSILQATFSTLLFQLGQLSSLGGQTTFSPTFLSISFSRLCWGKSHTGMIKAGPALYSLLYSCLQFSSYFLLPTGYQNQIAYGPQ